MSFSKAQCDLKHRLLFMEIITEQALLKAFNANSLPLHIQIQENFSAALAFYKEYAAQQESKVAATSADFEHWDATFEKHLARLYKNRFVLWRQWEMLLHHQTGTDALLDMMDVLDSKLDTILGFINLDKQLSPGMRVSYEAQLKSFSGAFTALPRTYSNLLHTFFKKDLHQAQRVAALLQTYRLWQSFFVQQTEKIKTKAVLDVSDALLIKELLSTQKPAVLKTGLKKLTHSQETLTACLLHEVMRMQQEDTVCFNLTVLLQRLKEKFTTLRVEINAQEKHVQRYSYATGLRAGLFGFLTRNTYYQLSEASFTTLENTLDSPHFARLPLANVKMTEGYRKVFKTATAGTILAWELSESSQYGLPFLMLQNLSRWVTSDLEVWCRFYKMAQKDEYDLILSQDKLRLGVGFGIVLAHQTAQLWWKGLGWSWSVIGLSSGWYLAAVAGQVGLGKLIGWLFGEEQSSSHFLFNVAQAYAGYSLGGYGFLKTLEWFAPLVSPLELLQNQQLCDQHPVECRVAAFQALRLDEQSTVAEIRKACRQLPLQYHPDKGGTLEQVEIINQACALLKR